MTFESLHHPAPLRILAGEDAHHARWLAGARATLQPPAEELGISHPAKVGLVALAGADRGQCARTRLTGFLGMFVPQGTGVAPRGSDCGLRRFAVAAAASLEQFGTGRNSPHELPVRAQAHGRRGARWTEASGDTVWAAVERLPGARSGPVRSVASMILWQAPRRPERSALVCAVEASSPCVECALVAVQWAAKQSTRPRDNDLNAVAIPERAAGHAYPTETVNLVPAAAPLDVLMAAHLGTPDPPSLWGAINRLLGFTPQT
jgi:hypothetical protein